MAPIAATQFSASKLRRIRGTSTKHKLYEASQQSHTLSIMSSQIAMLTSSVDVLIGMLYNSHFHQTPGVDAGASQFPNAEATEYVPLASRQSHRHASTRGGDIVASVSSCESVFPMSMPNNCAGCWEPLRNCYCGRLVFCSTCTQLFSDAGSETSLSERRELVDDEPSFSHSSPQAACV